MNLIPTDSKYIPLTQQRWCCVPTCIQMVMLRHKIPLVPAELLGYKMGLIVPKSDSKYFWHVRTGKRPPAGFGTQQGSRFNPNTVFKKLKIPLKMHWSLINTFKNFNAFLKYFQNADSSIDTLLCFDWGVLHDDSKSHGGHVCLLDKVNLTKRTIRYIDPEFDPPKWQEVSMRKLFDAMVYHGKNNSGGFWELRHK